MRKCTSTFMGNDAAKRVVSFCLVMAMLLTMLPAAAMLPAANAVGQPAAINKTITVYFKNTDGWGSVYGYAWSGEEQLLGSWPGKMLAEESAYPGYYKMTLEYTGTALSFIFNNGTSAQTVDLTLSGAQLSAHTQWWVVPSGAQDGKVTCSVNKMVMPQYSGHQVTFTYTSTTASSVKVAGSMNGWTGAQMTESNNVFTYTTTLQPGVYEYKLVVDNNWINDPCNPFTAGTDNNNVLILTGLKDATVAATKGAAVTLPAELLYVAEDGTEEYRAVSYALKSASSNVTLSGNQITVGTGYTGSTLALSAATADGASATVTLNLNATAANRNVKIHFLNNVGWDVVCAAAWVDKTDGDEPLTGWSWPGQLLTQDADGYYTLELAFTPKSGESLGYLFHNNQGSQTVDLNVSYAALTNTGNVELWVQPKALSDNKYTCTTATSAASMFVSPVVNGTQITFRYKGTTSGKVYVVGSMNGWNKTANAMTKGSNGVYTCTMTLNPGAYQYKFYLSANDSWINDPYNLDVVGVDNNNIVVVPEQSAGTAGKVTVKIHYNRADGNYTSWNVWGWSDTASGAQYNFATENSEKVATITVDGSTTSKVGFIVRKGNWADQEFGDRFVDISAIGSGTVHCYVTSGVEDTISVLGGNNTFVNKIVSAVYNYETGKVEVKTSLPVTGALTQVFSIVTAGGAASGVNILGVDAATGTYILRLDRELELGELKNYRVKFLETSCAMSVTDIFSADRFAVEYTYNGDDLGANWSADSTTFKVWAPTAEKVQVALYNSGNYGTAQYQRVSMTRGDYGVWEATVSGDLNGKYYTYFVTVDGSERETQDPYAKSAGSNGDRSMVIDMDSTDPAGWDSDVSPHAGKAYTDAIIYETHVREFTIEESSGVSNAYRGTYLGLVESGATTAGGQSTGLDYLRQLGITHVQLMPVYDYYSLDEYHKEWSQYAWGYDPKNYNVPDGFYSTDPFDGSVRVAEFKQMVKTLHDNNISVVMDVVYNHAFDGGNFCFNKIVPNYFSRFYGSDWSNGSGCGNDTATEREMVRKYIVDSVLHWVEEYHIDGFRFDLAGLIDTVTINEIVNTVHAKYPHVIFYGEGWAPGSTAVEDGYALATQGNAWQTPGFGYFNDTIRDLVSGYNGQYTGVATGATGKEENLANALKGISNWSNNPSQTVNYVNCHDGYTLMDKISLTRSDASFGDRVKMNNLAASMYLLAQGIPMIYSGEDMLREKINEDGYRVDNSYSSSDYVNSIKWNNLDNATYADVADYYAGLIEFRKAHSALRLTSAYDVSCNVSYSWITNEVVMIKINGGVNGEISEGIVMIFNCNNSTKYVDMYAAGVASGIWKICIDGDDAGTDVLGTVTNGWVTLDPMSVTVLVKGKTGCDHSYVDGVCAYCGNVCGHDYVGGYCTDCGAKEPVIEQDYYLIGYINGKDYGCEGDAANMGDYKFVNGKLTASFEQDSYVFVKTTGNRNWYMTDGWLGTDVTSATLYSTSTTGMSFNKLFVPGGVELTFTLVENGDGTLTLSYAEAVPLFDIAGANMLLGSVLDMNFFIDKTDLTGTDYYAVITHYDKDGTKTVTVPYSGWDERSAYMVVTLEGLAARQMADQIEIVIYNGDGTPASNVWTDSVRSYAMRILEKQDAETKTMLVDMLNYGAAAQTYFEYNTGDLANNQLTAAQKNYATESVTCPDQRVKGTNYYGSTLVLKNRILLTMYFKNVDTSMYAMVSYTDHKGVKHENRIEGSAFAKYNTGIYGVTVDDLVVADGDQLVTVKVYNASGTQVAYASDSVNSYAQRMMSTAPLFEMVAKFTTAAYAYFH